jgi:hypothetical protein
MTVSKISISNSPAVMAQVLSRGPAKSTIINRDLERLYQSYDMALSTTELTQSEAMLICDCCNGSLFDAKSARMLWASIEDSCSLDGLDIKWEVDAKELIEKIRNLPAFTRMAIIDAAERIWNMDGDFADNAKTIFKIKPAE